MITLLLLAFLATFAAMLVCALALNETSTHNRKSRIANRKSAWASRFMLGLQEALALPATLWRQFKYRRHEMCCGANIASGTHAGAVTRKADAAIATRYLIGKYGSDADHIAIGTASAAPMGVITDEAAAAEDIVAVELLGVSARTLLMVASAAISADTDVYTAANGKVQELPAAAGTYYKVGRTLTASGADGDQIEVAHCHPLATVVS